jgi:hypothetical protein
LLHGNYNDKDVILIKEENYGEDDDEIVIVDNFDAAHLHAEG